MRESQSPENKRRRARARGDHKSPVESIMYRYHVTREQAEALLAIKECQICGGRKRICTDHDHETGEVRGRLCNRCNLSLEWYLIMREEIEDYLNRRATMVDQGSSS